MTAMEPIADNPGRRGAVAVILRDQRMLIIRRSRSVVAPLTYCFPGGGIEEGESEEAALVREVREEIGVAVRPVRRLWQCVTPWKVRLGWWLAEMSPRSVPVANPAEVESIHWVTPRQMAELPELLESNRIFLDLIVRGEIRLEADPAAFQPDRAST
jgi:8-oxo-dGTP pyrophosphatase MutT (NUDIX family)